MSLNNKRIGAKAIDVVFSLFFAFLFAGISLFIFIILVLLVKSGSGDLATIDFTTTSNYDAALIIIEPYGQRAVIFLEVLGLLLRILGIVLYFYLFAWIFKSSPGKKIFKLNIISTDDTPISNFKLIKREPFIQISLIALITNSAAAYIEILFFLTIFVYMYYFFSMLYEKDFWNVQNNLKIEELK